MTKLREREPDKKGRVKSPALELTDQGRRLDLGLPRALRTEISSGPSMKKRTGGWTRR
jgi:hypothetical protein